LNISSNTKILFELKFASNDAKILHGISQDNTVDLRRSIHEVEGLMRIVEKGSKRDDVMVVKYTLDLLKTQLKVVREKQNLVSHNHLEREISKCKTYKERRDVKRNHAVEVQRRLEVENVLVKMCSLDPVRQALFLKDRRAMNHMTGRFSTLKKALYKSFIAEKEGFIPDDVERSTIIFCESIAFMYILFLTFYLYKHSLVEGQITTLLAVTSFCLELILSFFVISPFYIFIKFVVLPSYVAKLVEVDVKTAQVEYKKKVRLKRMKGLSKIDDGSDNIVTRTTRVVSESVKRFSRALSIGNGDSHFTSSTSTISENDVHNRSSSIDSLGVGFMEEGDGVELNPIVSRSRHNTVDSKTRKSSVTRMSGARSRKASTATDNGDGQSGYFTHYDDSGNPYFEDIGTGVTSYTPPDGWEDDKDDDMWESIEGDGGVYYVNERTRRTTWTDRSGDIDVGRAGDMVENGGGGKWGKIRDNVVKKDGWDTIYDAVSGANYFVDRRTGRTSWTDRTGEATGERESCDAGEKPAEN
jgi:hypothetical protein